MKQLRVAIVVLAAGRSSRMEGSNKLLATFAGEPLVRRSVRTALAAAATRVVVITGHRALKIADALDGLAVEIHENADYAAGLSGSLRFGFRATLPEADGVLVMLADQPALTPANLDALIAAFRPVGAGSIVVATNGGVRGNPVVLSAVHAEAIEAIRGDRGARDLVRAEAPLVVEVEIGEAALLDVDTPEALARAGGVPEIAPARRS